MALIMLFAFSVVAYGTENNQIGKDAAESETSAPVRSGESANSTDLLAEQAEENMKIVNSSFQKTPDIPTGELPATTPPTAGTLVDRWLQQHAVDINDRAQIQKRGSFANRSLHVHQDMEMEGGGWCDICGCWMKHGLDPNGTPQSEIGHPYVCTGGADSQNCWSHYYRYCFSS